MIQPGLARITSLLSTTALPWRAIHVAGTNGKGSICNYVASMLNIYNRSRLPALTGQPQLTWAKFTSPHLIDRWDGISIGGENITRAAFEEIENQFIAKARTNKIEASEFELLTATAFEAFSRAEVDIGIVEVGMGGTLDATNIVGQEVESSSLRAKPLVTAISKIGLDHQKFLGNSIEEIAKHKAGIMKPGIPVVYDESNTAEVRSVLDACAAKMSAQTWSLNQMSVLSNAADWMYLPSAEKSASYQADTPIHAHIRQNTSVALRASWLALSQLGRLRCPASTEKRDFETSIRELVQDMSTVSKHTANLGRLERVRLSLGGTTAHLLLDGAHNAQSAAALADEVVRFRQEAAGERLGWIVAVSNGRDTQQLLQPLLAKDDIVHVVEFGPVDGMPWVVPVPAEEIASVAATLVGNPGLVQNFGNDIELALQHSLKACNWTVAAGSLYLIGDIHRLLQNRKNL